jgi:tetratricopeptide (TPR) repeat protein
MLELYSLFSEYHKNRDFKSAEPYGWQVLDCDKKKFAKWIYYKLEETLWYLRDSSDITPEHVKTIDDSILGFYDTAIKNYPDAKGYFASRKAFVAETWLEQDPEEIIKLYEVAISMDSTISSYYYDRLGELYTANADESNGYDEKAIDIYTYLGEREPDEPLWSDKLADRVEDDSILVEVLRKAWEKDKENPEKAWKYASTAIRTGMHNEAIVPLEFLVKKSPESTNYWSQLATAYHKTDQLTKAENAYKKTIQLEPNKREHYSNLGLIYKDKSQYSTARSQFEKASQIGNGWGLPIYYLGNMYEQVARSCGFEFEDKLVFLLAVDTYRRAKNMDQGIATQAQERISVLATSVPTQEDYFFRGHKTGDVISIPNNSCYSWIGKSITVP